MLQDLGAEGFQRAVAEAGGPGAAETQYGGSQQMWFLCLRKARGESRREWQEFIPDRDPAFYVAPEEPIDDEEVESRADEQRVAVHEAMTDSEDEGEAQVTGPQEFISAQTPHRPDTRFDAEWTRFDGDLTLDEKESLYLRVTSRKERIFPVKLQPIEGHNYARIVLIGDLHMGPPFCDYPRFCALTDFIGERPPGWYWAGMGDFFDMKTGTSKGLGNAEQVLPYNDCFPILKRRLSPIANRCLFLLRGNHEEAIAKDTKIKIDPMSHFADELGVSYLGKAATVSHEIGDQKYIGVYHHGHGGAQTPQGKFGPLIRMIQYSRGADFGAMGHTHGYGLVMLGVKVDDGQGHWVQDKIPAIQTGSFYKHEADSYPSDGIMTPAVLGAATVFLYADKHNVHARV